MTLYETLQAAGVGMTNHESDLYFEVNDTTTAILARFPLEKRNATRFRDQTNGHFCYDVPFAYQPYWERKIRN